MYQRLLFFILLTLAACASESEHEKNQKRDINRAEQTEDVSLANESFREFYKIFSSDSAYQVSHIIFPLLVETYDIDNDGFINSTMDRKEWGYMDFDLKKPYILKTESAIDTIKINIQMEETGVFVDYLFTTVNKTWMLVKVVDKST
ncbi:MAG: hypothetical protein K0Q79_2213 [Flavipsychrobacter sp.]|nr:hypothetical protein [Flavipsychrobacter sp.]